MRTVAYPYALVAGEYLRAVHRLLSTAAVGSDGGRGEAPSEPPGAVQDAAPANPYEAERSVRTRTRRTARDSRRVGVVAPAAPTTQRNGPAA